MMLSVGELIDIAYRYYPRGVPRNDPRYEETEEYLRLAAARRRAGAECDAWRSLLRRLDEQFPENNLLNDSIHLPTGSYDAGYSGALFLPTSIPGEHSHRVGFLVSFLVPYYIVYSLRIVDDLTEPPPVEPTPPKLLSVYQHDTMYVLPIEFTPIVKPDLIRPYKKLQPTRHDISFEPSPDEAPYAAWITREIEATFGGERMPPEVGKVVVPDVVTNLRSFGEATLYDCLFSDHCW